MNDKYGFNTRRCNFASTLSGCIKRNQRKVLFALPTDDKTVELFEKPLIGGFSLVITMLSV